MSFNVGDSTDPGNGDVAVGVRDLAEDFEQSKTEVLDSLKGMLKKPHQLISRHIDRQFQHIYHRMDRHDDLLSWIFEAAAVVPPPLTCQDAPETSGQNMVTVVDKEIKDVDVTTIGDPIRDLAEDIEQFITNPRVVLDALKGLTEAMLKKPRQLISCQIDRQFQLIHHRMDRHDDLLSWIFEAAVVVPPPLTCQDAPDTSGHNMVTVVDKEIKDVHVGRAITTGDPVRDLAEDIEQFKTNPWVVLDALKGLPNVMLEELHQLISRHIDPQFELIHQRMDRHEDLLCWIFEAATLVPAPLTCQDAPDTSGHNMVTVVDKEIKDVRVGRATTNGDPVRDLAEDIDQFKTVVLDALKGLPDVMLEELHQLISRHIDHQFELIHRRMDRHDDLLSCIYQAAASGNTLVYI